jgi:hypothetical protein
MMRRLWLNLALLLIVIVLAVVAFLEPGSQQPESRRSLLSLSPAQVTQIQLQRNGAQTLQIERVDNGWMIVKPIRIAASDYRIDALLQLLNATSYASFPLSARPLSSFGLDKPSSQVSFNEQTVMFGDNEPLNNRRYILAGDQVQVIDDRYFYQSQLLLTALVDAALVPGGRSLKQIKLPGIVLQQHQGVWRATQFPSAETAEITPDSSDVSALVDEWRSIRALQISEYQSDVPEANIELVFADGETMPLEILARDPELILGRRSLNLRFHFSADQADRLLSLPSRETVADVPVTHDVAP